MIRMTWGSDKWLLTTQVEQARLAGIIAASWNFDDKRPHDEVIKAIMYSAEGWKSFDTLPILAKDDLNSENIFPVMSDIDYFQANYESVESRFQEGQFYGTVVLSRYFEDLTNDISMAKSSIKTVQQLGGYLSKLRNLRNKSLNNLANHELDLSESRINSDVKFISACVELSKVICTDYQTPCQISQVPYLSEADIELNITKKLGSLSAVISPLPFKKNLRDHLSSWIIPQSTDSADAVIDLISNTKPVTNEVHLGAGSS